ncbi:MAG: putative zinc-binding metallopeptidase [Acidobacteria bacterium]|nr:putative zinc-binding metallopeptidase [Acidobacteriota bacterium]
MSTSRAAALRARRLIQSWETERFELLNKRICDLDLKLEGTVLQKCIDKLYRELERRHIRFRPACYLSNEWGCPDRIPMIGLPFYLADPRLTRINNEINKDTEGEEQIMMGMRHETGHAINYAHKLYNRHDWCKVFGAFSKPYRDIFKPNPFSKNYVKHLEYSGVRVYAQKHPDEDFAETFAVWLYPFSNWREKYRNWGALKKLKYMDQLMKEIGRRPPLVKSGRPHSPVEEMDYTVLEYYKKDPEDYKLEAQGYCDDVLEKIFEESPRWEQSVGAWKFIRRYRSQLIANISDWTGENRATIQPLIDKLISRARDLNLYMNGRRESSKLVELTAVATTFVMNYVYEGKFIVI